MRICERISRGKGILLRASEKNLLSENKANCETADRVKMELQLQLQLQQKELNRVHSVT